MTHEEFARLWTEGMLTAEIARRAGMSRLWVSLQARRMGLPARTNGGMRVAQDPISGPMKQKAAGCGSPARAPAASEPDPPSAVRLTATPPRLDAELYATGGRYPALAAYAERHGITLQAAQCRWHRLRVPVRVDRDRAPVPLD